MHMNLPQGISDAPQMQNKKRKRKIKKGITHMKYISTRDTRGEAAERISSAEAIKRGLAPDGGLYLPETIPATDIDFIRSLSGLGYNDIAVKILSLYLDDYTEEELRADCTAAYDGQNFDGTPAPIKKAGDGVWCMELWHGPTSAFKDMALQLMPRLLSRALKKTGEDRTALVLVATSGDTGKAALEGYKDVPGVAIKVFYPVDGVSRVQKLQMMTQEGQNVDVCAIKGNFDDAQSGVKSIFGDPEMRDALDRRGYFLSSANSINWGRLVPQIVYYYAGYAQMADAGIISWGDSIDVAVPTGNFGNIFAAYLARRMGLPLRRLVCASNSNNILTDFLSTGKYDRNRKFYTTMSPSMDILISSNLERLIYLMTDAETTKKLMSELSTNGCYSVSPDTLRDIRECFDGYFADEDQTGAAIARHFSEQGYLFDTHTAVAVSCTERYLEKLPANDRLPMLVASTASPYKFAQDVLSSLTDGKTTSEGTAALGELSRLTDTRIPAPLDGLDRRTVRFDRVIAPADMPEDVLHYLK